MNMQHRHACAGLDIDALHDVATAVNGLREQRPQMGLLLITHYKVGKAARIWGRKLVG